MNREQKRLRVLIVSSSEKAEHLLRDSSSVRLFFTHRLGVLNRRGETDHSPIAG